MADLIIENGDSLIVKAGDVIPGEGSTQQEPAGTRVFEVTPVGDVLMGPNTLTDPAHWHTGTSAAAVDDFRFDAATRGITTRGLGLTQVRDPVDFVIARAEGGLDAEGNDDRTQFTGIEEGTNLGAIYWRGTITPAGGTPGATPGAGWGGRSAQIYVRSAEDFRVDAEGGNGGHLIIGTTPVGSTGWLSRLIVSSRGVVGVLSAVLSEDDVAASTERGQLLIGGSGGRCIRFLNNGPELIVAPGSPGSAIAQKGSVWLRTDGGPGSTLYVKTAAPNTGSSWTVVA